MENKEKLENADLPARPKPIFLLLIEGWGVTEKNEANAISVARTPNFLRLVKDYPAAILETNNNNINSRYLSLGSGVKVDNETQAVNSDLSLIISQSSLRQLKILDNERLAAFTSFFNAIREDKLPGEDWLTISLEDNSQSINSFLGLKRLVRESVKAIKNENYDFIAATYSGLDFSATKGDFSETVKVVESLDKAIRTLELEILEHRGILVIAASGGNAEKMIDMATDLPNKEMTNNPVPLIIVGLDFKGKTIGLKDAPEGDLSLLKPAGNLSDVAPTILDLMNLEKDGNMTGSSLIV
ncbi:MAG: hypothetical protein COU31_02170 [Candidatus Magasanikbacteria bacterium CG10_big_fil_rev_8_21_14_0_10_40_10]|uniref:Metalloenzyme domain-containing protein n=1 Tax=Candidatus Magasanikbacteria bacterium CG10_big_fil_rev_8_21_14_0_10_40_10 TaxID=1974648 RepID=A0A2M6W446_9BACT|nr:MAG: hypothetical protein COU31_02170 [Candidatus Magasanikbacteria bacterium CG10_big_fil_rev_8_21_14_0_10_40_10]